MSPLSREDLDGSAFAQWVDGEEKSLQIKRGPSFIMWTKNSRIEWSGMYYADSKKPGVRHMRIGWKQAVPVGTVLARAGGKLSVLRSDATYPGKLNDDSQWIPAVRLKDRKVTRREVNGEDFGLWVLPPKTVTRAIRFTHVPELTDKTYAGWLGGVCVLSDRFANMANQSIALTTANAGKAFKVNDESNNGCWGTWDNGEVGAEQVVSEQSPEVLDLLWPQEVSLRGLVLLWAGFGECEVLAYRGPADRGLRDASQKDWESVGAFGNLANLYPLQLAPNWVDLSRTVTTRALRVRMTKATAESHPHLNGKTKGGKRVWLGDIMALHPLAEAGLATAALPARRDDFGHPPIPIRFSLKEDGLVTLVIEDEKGVRVRNLVSETPFPKGENTAWWDGMDDLGRDTEAAKHGVYNVPGKFVKPATFQVRGLTHKEFDLHLEFSVYNAGSPAWTTNDNTGGWTTNHTPPNCVEFVPGDNAPGGNPLVFIGSHVAEGGHGLIWVDLEGRKRGGRGHIGGGWTGAQHLARDKGPEADAKTYLYVGSGWDKELRLTALTRQGDKQVVKYAFKNKADSALAGIAVHNGLMVCSLPAVNQLLFINAKGGKVLGTVGVKKPSGVAFGIQGRLFVLAEKELRRYTLSQPVARNPRLPEPRVLVRDLEEPQQIAFDRQGNIYVSDRGRSHQVKVFTPEGRALRKIGKPGMPKAGPYDRLHMNSPSGLTIDEKGRLWVAEADMQPKRVSAWDQEGKLLKAFYGPSMYGGGGTLDHTDKTRFYFGGMKFKLDWVKGKDKLVSVLYRKQKGDAFPPDAFGCNGMPEMPHYVDGRRYFSNWHTSNPTNGAGIATIWLDKEGGAVPVAAIGSVAGGNRGWGKLREPEFLKRWPKGVDPKGNWWQNRALFSWTDHNVDTRMQPDEVNMVNASSGGVTVMPDLSVVVSRVNEKTMVYRPVRFDKGVPVYDLTAGDVAVTGVHGPASSGGDQALVTDDGWVVATNGIRPFHQYSVCGALKGEAKWSYPNLWPGLHPSHEAPVADMPGQIIGPTRLLGSFITPRNSDAGPCWVVNGNMGPMYMFTVDGLFVASIFQDVRVGKSWHMPAATRNMKLNKVSTHDENFWPSITQTEDGAVYIVDGGHTTLVRVDNLDTIRRLPTQRIQISEEDMIAAREYHTQREVARQKQEGSRTLKVAMRKTAPVVDGKLEEWRGSDWAAVDKRGVAAWFDSKSRPYNVSAAVCVSGGKLYAAWRTSEPELLKNSGEMANAPFKTGGALDIMIGADPRADPKRAQPVQGDIRLLITRVKGKNLALVYRAVVPGTKEPVPFSSPWRTVHIDRVDDVSDQVQLAVEKGGHEISVPLAALGLKPTVGMKMKADIGVLRGDGSHTSQRVYWCNKGAAITSDVPSEAMLMPRLWGRWHFVDGK